MYGILLSHLDWCDLVATWNCQTSCRNEYAGLLVLHLSLFLKPSLIVEMWPAYFFSIGINLVDILQNWLTWFHLLFIERVLLDILIVYMIFLSRFLDVTRISMSTVSFLVQLDSGILCLQNAFLLPMILVALSLELTDIF